MTQTRTPMDVALAWQERALTNTQDALEQTMEAQRQFSEAVTHSANVDWTDADWSVDQGYEMAREAIDRYFELLEAVTPQGLSTAAAQDAVEEAFDAMEAASDEGIGSWQDDNEVIDMLEALFAPFEELPGVAPFPTDFDEPQTAFETYSDEFTAMVEEQMTLFESQLSELETLVEDLETVGVADDSEDSDDSAVEIELESTDGDGEPVETVSGIGPTYAERLAAAGIETTADLAATTVEQIAAAAEVSETRAQQWLDAVADE